MNKIEKVFDSYWGIVIFYIIIALLALNIFTGSNNINNKVVNNESETYLA